MSQKIVFVDPEDEKLHWWWPALVVSSQDFDSFAEFVSYEGEEPLPGELLVCYFEDGSFSVVQEDDVKPFDVHSPPFTEYSQGSFGKEFIKDKGISAALKFIQEGDLPEGFEWLEPRKVKKVKMSPKKAVSPLKAEAKVEANSVNFVQVDRPEAATKSFGVDSSVYHLKKKLASTWSEPVASKDLPNAPPAAVATNGNHAVDA